MSACEKDSNVVKDYVEGTNGKNSKDSMDQGAGNPSFLAVDIFCGGGGTTRGLIDANGYIIAGVDKVKTCRETYLNNNVNRFIDYSPPRFLGFDLFPESELYPQGEQQKLMSELCNLIPYYQHAAPKTPLLFTICAPCQPFTNLSNKNKFTAERLESHTRDMNLLSETVRFIECFRPELLLCENVRGITNTRFGEIWIHYRETLEALGYVTGTKLVCASRFGIAQFRKRYILLAVRRELVNPDRLKNVVGTELLVPEADPDAEIVSVREAIDHLPPIKAGEAHTEIPNHRARALSVRNLRRLSSAAPGQSNAYMENTEFGDLSLDCHRRLNQRTKARCFSDVYTRMHPDRPSPTITTKCHSISNGRFGHYDTAQVRGISLREAAILQSFPDEYVFYPTNRIDPVARMIGNAVPPQLASFFADYLVNSIDSRTSFREI